MAFNPLSTFHKNKRFWMAAILMVCMVTFVFCAGGSQRGLEDIISFRRGQTFLKVNGSNYTAGDMDKLREQRKLANTYMTRSAEFAFRKLTSAIMEISKKVEGDKDQKRKEELTKLQALRMSLADRKSKPLYFEGGLKLDDLVEFKLWQLEADRRGIRLEEDLIIRLYDQEMYIFYLRMVGAQSLALDANDLGFIERETARASSRGVSAAFILRAVGEEFRVRMAQEAVLGSQPGSFFFRGRNPNQGPTPKISQSDLPDEIRAPMTPAQLWDFYKTKRAEFSVTLLPFHVEDFVPQVKAEPTEVAKNDFFEAHKGKPYDPASPDWGLEIPQHVKIEYLIADLTSPAYVEMAKFKLAMEVLSPFATSPMQSPLVTAANYASAARAHREVLERKYIEASRRKNYGGAAYYREPDALAPVLAYLAKDHPEAAASLVGRSVLTPMDPYAGMAGYLNYQSWGQVKHPDVVAASARAELKRRAPSYALLFAASASQNPLDLAFPFLALDRIQGDPGADPRLKAMGFFMEDYVPPMLTLETVQKEIEEMLVRETAREWAQANIRSAKRALDKRPGSAEDYKRDLAKLVPQLKLTYGPPADKKSNYYDRYTVGDAKELAPLKEAFEKYIDIINFAEGRDVSPETLLKSGDFYKMFFDPTEPFSAASTTKYHAMTWPPRVKTNAARAWKGEPDPRYIDREKLRNDPENVISFLKHLHEQDPNKAPKDFDGLFENADKPILFWRTEVIEPVRPADLTKLEKDLQKSTAEFKKIDEERKAEKDPAKLAKLTAAAARVSKEVNDLKTIQDRIVEGWKLEQARENFALPYAKKVAQDVVKTNDSLNVFTQEADLLKKLAKPHRTLIHLPNLSLMHPEEFGNKVEYAPPPMPKGVFEYPRPDIMAQVLGLYDLQKPIKIDYKELDEFNKELFDQVKKEKKPGNFVQILTNKPRSVYYIAAISKLPEADLRGFARTMANASYPDNQFSRMDYFVTRAQQEEGRRFRQQIIEDFKRTANYEPPTEEGRKNFDDKGGGD